MFALLVAAVAAPLSAVGGAASSAPTAVHAVVVGSDGQLVAVERDGTTHQTGVDASITGRTVDLDGDGVLETPFVDSGGTLKLAEPDGTTTTLAESARASKSAIGVGDLDGDGTAAVFYPNASDSGYVYKVETGPDPGEPTRVTETTAKGVAGVGDLDGDDEPELAFAGGSSTVKYVDGDTDGDRHADRDAGTTRPERPGLPAGAVGTPRDRRGDVLLPHPAGRLRVDRRPARSVSESIVSALRFG